LLSKRLRLLLRKSPLVDGNNEIVQRLDASNNFKPVRFANSEAQLRSLIDNQAVLFAVVFPADFSCRFGAGTETPMQVIAEGRRSNTAQIRRVM
jgi:ABC-2 type transport system permease protein